MLDKRYRMSSTLLAGVLLGAASGYFLKSPAPKPEPISSSSTILDEEKFVKAASTDSCIMLAHALSHADADKCAALARTMLTKSVITTTYPDPFAAESDGVTVEDYLPQKAWEGLFKRWMQVDPLAAWDFVKAHHSDELLLREAALSQWALLDPSAAVRAAGAEISKNEKVIILKACAESNPSKGLMLVAEWQFIPESYPFREDGAVLPRLLKELAKKSPTAAIEWCQTNSPDLLFAACLGWNHNDPKTCLQWIQNLPIEQQQDIMKLLCEQPDVSAASLRHFASLCEPDEVLTNLQKGLSQIAKLNEDLSQQLIDELFSNPADRMQLRGEIGESMSIDDPRKAMNFILPALRTPLPVFETPATPFVGCGVGSGMFPVVKSNKSDYLELSQIVSSYLELGPTAGVDKKEVLAMLRDIHPQYIPWMLQENSYQLEKILGSPAQWAQEFYSEQSHEALSNMFRDSASQTADAGWQEIKATNHGPLRDLMLESWIEIQFEREATVATVMEQLSQFPDRNVDFSSIYANWMDNAPEAAMKHFMENPHASSNEWDSIIDHGFEDYAEQVQNRATALPPGELRNSVALAISSKSLAQQTDYVTSMYWATEVSAKKERSGQIRAILEQWQSDRNASQDSTIIEGVRDNIARSALSASEKALWLERIESEVLR